jgi:hypothetical protein
MTERQRDHESKWHARELLLHNKEIREHGARRDQLVLEWKEKSIYKWKGKIKEKILEREKTLYPLEHKDLPPMKPLNEKQKYQLIEYAMQYKDKAKIEKLVVKAKENRASLMIQKGFRYVKGYKMYVHERRRQLLAAQQPSTIHAMYNFGIIGRKSQEKVLKSLNVLRIIPKVRPAIKIGLHSKLEDMYENNNLVRRNYNLFI